MENYPSNEPNSNQESSAWDNLAKEKEIKDSEKKHMFGDEVMNGYKVASMPFENKSDAYQQISESWRGTPNITTYFEDGKWYIVVK